MKKNTIPYLLIIIVQFSLLCISCKKIIVPTLTTKNIANITRTTASSGGLITSNGGATVIAKGVCWSTSNDPTINDSKTVDGAGTESYTSNITDLDPNTTFYIRAYATNSAGTGYGNELVVKTYTGTVTDIEGNIYNTVTIGKQIWITENLKTTKYKDGSTIPNITELTEWLGLKAGAYCWYNNNEGIIPMYNIENVFGALYNWYAVSTSNLCPVGWHVPAYIEFITLSNYLGDYGVAGGKLKESGITHWGPPNLGATNETSFTALPGGFRSSDTRAAINGYTNLLRSGDWWSASEYNTDDAWSLGLFYTYSSIEIHPFSKESGLSVRCVKDSV